MAGAIAHPDVWNFRSFCVPVSHFSSSSSSIASVVALFIRVYVVLLEDDLVSVDGCGWLCIQICVGWSEALGAVAMEDREER